MAANNARMMDLYVDGEEKGVNPMSPMKQKGGHVDGLISMADCHVDDFLTPAVMSNHHDDFLN